jgi:prepilin-type N-terminal cleavage/methylation domain-containing protein
MNRLRLRAEGGFTLIELLVVIAIIGILAAIAIPQFAAYRRRGFVAQVQSDIRNAATAQESVFAATQAYAPACNPCTAVELPGFNPTTGVTIVGTLPAAGTFQLVGTHAQCGADTWTYTSVNGTVAPVVAVCT